MNQKPKFFDALILICFCVFITFQPYLFHHEIIMMETGIHLPAISAFFKGAVPYKDFFYLRGPLELYVPAFMMLLFGENMSVLPIFYYAGSVATLLAGILLARRIFRTRLVFYLMVLVLIGRTFPRVSFYYWGGMRYALGLFALYCAVRCFEGRRVLWMAAAGVVSCLGLLTTIETGVAVMIAVVAALVVSFLFGAMGRRFTKKLIFAYVAGVLAVLIPSAVYLAMAGALIPYLETTYTVLTRMTQTFVDAPGNHPESFVGFLRALIPGSPYFKFMTPVYCYAAFLGYLIRRKKRNAFNGEISSLMTIAVYGIVLYIAAFRKIAGHHFEMALQPEKILLFFMLEEAYLAFIKVRARETERIKTVVSGGWHRFRERKKIYFTNFLVFTFIGSSLGYAFARYNKRFTMAKLLGNTLGYRRDKDLSLLHEVEKRSVRIRRAQGMVVPVWQAQEMEGVVGFLEEHTKAGEAVFAYPELGNFNFWADRPFIGRFPIATFSWIDEQWHRELVADFKKAAPRYVVMTNPGHRTFPREWYFRNRANAEKFNEMTRLILDHYRVVQTYESVSIYERK